MNLWAIAAVLAIALVLAWSWLEPKEAGMRSPFQGVTLPVAVARAALFLALTVAIHAAIDPSHDKQTLQVHLPQMARAAYAFSVTVCLLLAFPTLRITWGAGLVVLAVGLMEGLQAVHVLPGFFRVADPMAAIVGVAAAAGPMWIGAHRARANMAREEAVRQERAAWRDNRAKRTI